jgi:hypothetical protein
MHLKEIVWGGVEGNSSVAERLVVSQVKLVLQILNFVNETRLIVFV